MTICDTFGCVAISENSLIDLAASSGAGLRAKFKSLIGKFVDPVLPTSMRVYPYTWFAYIVCFAAICLWAFECARSYEERCMRKHAEWVAERSAKRIDDYSLQIASWQQKHTEAVQQLFKEYKIIKKLEDQAREHRHTIADLRNEKIHLSRVIQEQSRPHDRLQQIVARLESSNAYETSADFTPPLTPASSSSSLRASSEGNYVSYHSGRATLGRYSSRVNWAESSVYDQNAPTIMNGVKSRELPPFMGTLVLNMPLEQQLHPTAPYPVIDLAAVSVVEDLQLSPALVIEPDWPVERAIGEALLRDFSILPVVKRGAQQAVTGWVDVRTLQADLAQNKLAAAEPVSRCLRHFERSRPYTLITPDTGLRELESFFQQADFALVTDQGRKFVLAVCTKEDLQKFLDRSMPHSPRMPGH